MFSTFQQPILNASGQVAFTATLTGPGVTFMNDSGLWATNEDHELILVAREGNMFDVSVDPMIIDLREIAAVHLRTGSAGRGRAFIDTGQLAFALDFRPSGNGAFVATIPPPTRQCYPDCDTSTGQGVLDIFDFLCFGSAFSAGCN